MRSLRRAAQVVVTTAVLVLIGGLAAAQETVPMLVNYQGKLG